MEEPSPSRPTSTREAPSTHRLRPSEPLPGRGHRDELYAPDRIGIVGQLGVGLRPRPVVDQDGGEIAIVQGSLPGENRSPATQLWSKTAAAPGMVHDYIYIHTHNKAYVFGGAYGQCKDHEGSCNKGGFNLRVNGYNKFTALVVANPT